MDEKILNGEPRLVSAGQGFSFLNTIEYKGRLLYSKYNPQRAILSLIEKTQLLPGTLVVICSPGLWYGIEQLAEKLPEDSMILAVENDEKLFTVSQNAFYDAIKNLSDEKKAAIHFLPVNKINSFLQTYGTTGMLRRAIKIDFCAGVQFAEQFYMQLTSIIQDYIAQFWKNRLTLVRLGRLYSRNVFRNLSMLPGQGTLEQTARSVNKTIVVCGAGESLEQFIEYIKFNEKQRKYFFILAVDASLSALSAAGIKPDAAVTVECQRAIEYAFYSWVNSGITLFADISSRPQIQDITKANVIWFASRYADSTFLNSLQQDQIIDSFLPPMGSVGLVALDIALSIRRNENVPVLTTGLDFSWTCGKTHAKGTPAHCSRLNASDRLHPVENYDASFKQGAFAEKGKNGSAVFTDNALSGYAKQFIHRFAGRPNVFDIGTSGLNLQLPQKNIEDFSHMNEDGGIQQLENVTSENLLNCRSLSFETKCSRIIHFYRKEENILNAVKDLLANGNNSQYRDNTLTLDQQLTELLLPRDYLYLHFPDGYKFSLDPSYLKRIKAEANFFLKDIKLALTRNETILPFL